MNDLPRNRYASSSPLPPSGGWSHEDSPGERVFVDISPARPFVLENGATLAKVVMAYETWGTLDADCSNAVLICHALTGDSHAASHTNPSDGGGWWEELIGPRCAIDTDKYFVVCINVLGGCQGSTGPASLDPVTEKPYGSTFPTITIRDIVRAQAKVADHLGINRWHAVIGGSMGGMQVLEWGVMFPDRVAALAAVATGLAASAQQIAWSSIGRAIVALDPKWRGGDYYDAAPGDGPYAGLAIARGLAQIHYRSDTSFEERFARRLVKPQSLFGLWDQFQVESYLDYHGEKLVKRFDANSYLFLNKAMDTHDLARGRQSLEDAVRRIEAPVWTASVSTDFLYPPHQQAKIQDLLTATGGRCDYRMIENPNGHDGFLLATEEVGDLLVDLFDRIG